MQAREAERYAHERGLGGRVSFRRMDAMALDFADSSFDAAWAFECLFHMPDRAQVLRVLARVVRPVGRLVLTDSCTTQQLSELETRLVHEGFQVNAFITPEQYAELLSSVGFRVLETLADGSPFGLINLLKHHDSSVRLRSGNTLNLLPSAILAVTLHEDDFCATAQLGQALHRWFPRAFI